MPQNPHENALHENIDFCRIPLSKGEYDQCEFRNCNFADLDLSACRFTDCRFISCNLSLAKLYKTSLKDVVFQDCKLMGLHFEDCHDFLFSVRFEGCNLNYSSFLRMKMKKTQFHKCSLQECDFTETDLREAAFNDCDLLMARFEATHLEKADLRTAFNFSIHPEANFIKGTRFSLAGLPGLLDGYGIEIED